MSKKIKGLRDNLIRLIIRPPRGTELVIETCDALNEHISTDSATIISKWDIESAIMVVCSCVCEFVSLAVCQFFNARKAEPM